MLNRERFTDYAQKSFRDAKRAAGSFGHSYVGTEHLLLGLTHQKQSIAGQMLAAAGVTASSDTHSIQSMLTMDALFL